MGLRNRELGAEPHRLRSLAILPARLGSTRLPRKMLLEDSGLPLVVHSARNAARCADFERVVVATDSAEVLAACEEHQVECLMTREDHTSGTDRVQEALDEICANSKEAFDVVVNVQGDEPDVDTQDLARLCQAFADRDVQVATLSTPIRSDADWSNPSVVKVVCDQNGDALYFSRTPIPSAAHARAGCEDPRSVARRHLGVYAFRPAALRRFCALERGRLENIENLEQLRWLEAGERLRVLPAEHAPLGVDTPEDYRAFVARATPEPC